MPGKRESILQPVPILGPRGPVIEFGLVIYDDCAPPLYAPVLFQDGQLTGFVTIGAVPTPAGNIGGYPFTSPSAKYIRDYMATQGIPERVNAASALVRPDET